MKICNKCGTSKEFDKFFKDKASSDGCYSICKACKKEGVYKWRSNNNERYNAVQRNYNKKHRRRIHYKRAYDMSVDEIAALFLSQKGLCAICGKAATGIRPLAVDHCHKTGQVRGMLCYGCNREIALLDDESKLKKALEYVERFRKVS